jgi:hypothetical protein
MALCLLADDEVFGPSLRTESRRKRNIEGEKGHDGSAQLGRLGKLSLECTLMVRTMK